MLRIHAASIAAIKFSLVTTNGLNFLKLWDNGEFKKLREQWPDAPESVYRGADPDHPETLELLGISPLPKGKLTAQSLFEFAESFEKSERNGFRTPTLIEAARHFKVSMRRIEEVCRDYQGKGYLGIAVAIITTGGTAKLRRSEQLVEAFPPLVELAALSVVQAREWPVAYYSNQVASLFLNI